MAHEATKRRPFLKATGAAAAAGLTGLAGCGGSGGSTPKLGMAFTVPVENIGSLFAVPEVRDQLDNLGNEYTLEVSRNESTPDSLNQMAAGSIDLALLSTVSYASAVKREAVPGNIKLVATDFWDAQPDWYGFTIYSGTDSDITEPKDLEGTKLGVNATGTGTHAILVKKLRQVGLDPENDVEIVELPFPTFTSAIKDGRLDAGIFPAIFAVSARGENFTEVYTSQETFDKSYPFAYTAASNSSLDDKPDAIKAWGEDLAQLISYCYDNRDTVVSAAAKHFELPESLVDGFFLTHDDYYRKSFNVDYERLQYAMDELVDLGFIDSSFDVKEYATNDYVPSTE